MAFIVEELRQVECPLLSLHSHSCGQFSFKSSHQGVHFVCFLSIERWDIFKEQLLMFFVYTYFCGAVYDDCVYSNVARASLLYTQSSYFCGAVYDDCVYSKLALATFSVFFIEEIIISTWLSRHKQITFEDCVEISYRYAREVEHSDINLNTLEEIFMERFN